MCNYKLEMFPLNLISACAVIGIGLIPGSIAFLQAFKEPINRNLNESTKQLIESEILIINSFNLHFIKFYTCSFARFYDILRKINTYYRHPNFIHINIIRFGKFCSQTTNL